MHQGRLASTGASDVLGSSNRIIHGGCRVALAIYYFSPNREI